MKQNRAIRLAGEVPVALACVLLLCTPAQAESQAKPPVVAKVESVQFPAWVERGGIKAGIKSGWAIYAGDRLITGANGRIGLTAIGDARLKVGGNADLVFTDLQPSATDTSLFKVNRGAFHFTAPVIGRPEGTLLTLGKGVNANILAGKIWGNAAAGQDLLVLLDGSAEVSSPKSPPVRMNKPETVVTVPHSRKLQPAIPVARERLAQWLGQTEPVSGHPQVIADGLWDVSLNSGYNLKELEEYACRVQSRGLPSEIYPVREPGKQVWYRVVVRRFATKEDAVDFARTGKSFGSKDAWVLLPQS
jgi:hypothetical protein